jgi:NADH:ubiquinone reductase (non-electrogenic)
VDKEKEFEYRHFGSFAYIGDHMAIAQIPSRERGEHLDLYGKGTFFLWRSVYFSKLLSYKNRFMVLTDWLKTFFFGRDVSRG